MEREFKCKDEVIYRSRKYENPIWTYGIFSHYEHRGGRTYAVVSGSCGVDVLLWDFLPYEGNEHLVGKMIDVEHVEVVDLMEGEWLMVSDSASNYPGEWMLRSLMYADGDEVMVQSVRFAYGDVTGYKFAIPFDKFKPDNMDESFQHLMCSIDSKLIKCKKH